MDKLCDHLMKRNLQAPMNTNYLGILTLLSYLGVAIAQTLHLFDKLPSTKWRYLTGSCLSIAGHGWVLYKLIETPDGQNLDWLIMLSFTLWMMSIFTLLCS